jgi:hypothetical protein
MDHGDFVGVFQSNIEQKPLITTQPGTFDEGLGIPHGIRKMINGTHAFMAKSSGFGWPGIRSRK